MSSYLRAMLATFLFCLAACNGTGNAPKAYGDFVAKATVCVDLVRENGDAVAKAAASLDGERMNTECVSGIDASREHVIIASPVDGLTVDNMVRTIKAGTLAGEPVENHVKFVYYMDMRTVHVAAKSPFGKPVAGEIFFDGRLVGTSYADITFDATEIHTVTFGAITRLTPPASITINGDTVDGSTIEGAYTGEVTEVCFRAFNSETGVDMSGVSVIANGESRMADGNDCYLADPAAPLRLSWGGAGNYGAQYAHYYPAYAFTQGTRRTIVNNFVPSSRSKSLCVVTTPINAEIFLKVGDDVFSLGYSNSDEAACTAVDGDETNVISFAEVAGHTSPADVIADFSSGNYSFTAYGLYDPAVNGLLCAKAQSLYSWSTTPEDNLYLSRVTIDNQVVKNRNGLGLCTGVATRDLHQVIWPASSQSNLAPPEHNPTVVPASTLAPGATYNVYGVYTQASVGQNDPKRVCVDIRNAWGGSLMGSVTSELGYSNTTSTYYCRMFSNAGSITFGAIDYLVTPEPVTVDPATLTISDSKFDRNSNSWVFQVVYQNQYPSALLCAEGYNHHGDWFESWFRMDGLQTYTMVGDAVTNNGGGYSLGQFNCAVAPVAMDHSITTTNWTLDQSVPSPIYVPAGRLNADTVRVFKRRYYLDVEATRVCVSTNPVSGEVIVNGESQGWVAIPSSSNCQLSISVDATISNTFSFSSETGYTTPNSVNYPARTLRTDGGNTLFVNYQPR